MNVDALARGSANGPIGVPRSRRPMLLVVDDQPVNIQVLYRALNHSYDILMATSGEQALALCAKRVPDLVLLDVIMPGMDGHEVCRRLKANSRTREVPVIFVTAIDEPAEETKGLELGACDYISKPISPAVVSARVRGHLALAESRALLAETLASTHRLNEELELRVAARTAELEKASKVADAANQAKGQLLANMSHEMRTPMNSILGMAYLAMQASPEPRVVGFLSHIQKAGQHLLGLIDDILDVSKCEAGRMALDIADFDVASVVARVAAHFSFAASENGLRLVDRVDPRLARAVRGDAMRLGQVLLNFVGNAVKFSDNGDVQIVVDVTSQDASGVQLHLAVSDNGIGIDTAQLPDLFQPFHQADVSSTRKYGGTGLGLAICRQLATLMGGTVGVDSEAGVGSTFWLDVRLDWALGAAELQPVPARLPTTSTMPSLHARRILVVDDNAINRLVASELLDAVGATVVEASDGGDALAQMKIQAFDIVLMDVQMPVMDGLEATRRIRLDPALAGTLVVAMTANAGRAAETSCRDAGMDAYITKPVEPAVFYRTLTQLVGPRPLASSIVNRKRAAAPSPVQALADGGPTSRLDLAEVSDPSVIDLSILLATLGGNIDKAKKYALLFCSTTADTLLELQTAIRSSDRAMVAMLCHRAKSPARTVGAMAFADLCLSLESSAETAEMAALRFAAGSLESLLRRITEAVNRAVGAELHAAMPASHTGDSPCLQ